MKNRLATITLLSALAAVLLCAVAAHRAAADPAPAALAPVAPPSVAYNWRNVEIVGGGFVTGIIFHPAQRDLIYARTDIGGAYRWDPAAKRWLPLNDDISADDQNLLGVESLAVDPSDPNRVYLAVGAYTASWAGNGAILRSADRGATWERTNMPFKMGGNQDGRSIGERLAVDPGDGRVLWFGSRGDGLWKSVDRGATWAKIESFPVTGATNGIGIGFILFDSVQAGRATSTIYAAVAAPPVALYRSTDGGATWATVPGQPEGLLPHHGALTTNGKLYVTYGDKPGPNGMTDGAVWKLDTATGAWTDITPIKPGEGDRFGYAGLAVDRNNPNNLMVTTMDRWARHDEIFRSTDGGATWTPIGPKSVRDSTASPFLNFGKDAADLGHWIGDIEIDPFNPDRVLYVTGATIWGSDDVTAHDSGKPTHWSVRAQGLEETAVIDLVSPPVGPNLISALGDIGGFRHDDLSVSPRAGMSDKPRFVTTRSLDFAGRKPNIVARVGSAGGGQRRGALSTDGGATWKPFPAEPPTKNGSGTIALSADGKTLVWTPRDTVAHVSRDGGATWTPVQGLPGTDPIPIVSDRVDPRRFYAFARKTGVFYVSTDGAATFLPAAPGLPVNRGGKVRLVPDRMGEIWLATEDGAFVSINRGASFTRVDGPWSAEAIGFGKAAPGRDNPAVYLVGRIGGVYGVFRSDDSGANWVRINDDRHRFGWIGQVVTGDPRIYGRVYLATNGRGIQMADPAVPAVR